MSKKKSLLFVAVLAVIIITAWFLTAKAIFDPSATSNGESYEKSDNRNTE